MENTNEPTAAASTGERKKGAEGPKKNAQKKNEESKKDDKATQN